MLASNKKSTQSINYQLNSKWSGGSNVCMHINMITI